MLVSLRARDFRNLAPTSFAPGVGSHLVLGDNGAGKTSLLEAIYVLATTRSFRTAHVEDCARHGAGGFHLEGELEAVARHRLEVGWGDGTSGPGAGSAAGSPSGAASGERYRAVNGHQASLAEHLEVQPVVAATAADSEVLTGAPALRRRMLDRGVVSTRPGALDALSRYRRTLRHKRDLLAQEGRRANPEELDTWNTVLATAAAEVIALRHAYTRRLEARLAEVLAEAELPFPEIALRYRPSPAVATPEVSLGSGPRQPGEHPSGDVLAVPIVDRSAAEAALLERFRHDAGAERRRGQPVSGPHRDDLEILWGGHPVKATVSAGERKALSLLLTAAHGRALAAADREPVYLLDDLDAELSATTLARVWRVFAGARQLLVTSNRPGVWSELPLDHRSRMVGGRLEEVP